MNPLPPFRIGLYRRVSSRQQTEGASLETQDEMGRAKAAEIAKEHGRDFALTDYVDVHRGEDLFERKDLMRLLGDIREKKLDVVIAHALDRLSRSGNHQGFIFSTADRVKCEIAFTVQKLDDTPEGRLINAVRGFKAEIEVLDLRERTTRGALARVAQGKALGKGRPPFGLRAKPARIGDDGKVVKGTSSTAYTEDESTIEHVKRMFVQRDAGMSLRQIGFDLERRGVLPPRHSWTGSTKWQTSTVKEILTNEVYTGVGYAFRERITKEEGRGKDGNKGTVAILREVAAPGEPVVMGKDDLPLKAIRVADGVYPVVIERALFDRVQTKITAAGKDRTESSRWDRPSEVGILRRGILRCPTCKNAMMVLLGAKGGPQYRCDAKSRHAHGCPCAGMQVAALDEAVWSWVRALRADPRRAAIFHQRLQGSVGDSFAHAMLADIDHHLEGLDARLRDLTDNLSLVTGAAAKLVANDLTRLADERERMARERQVLVRRVEAERDHQARIERMASTVEGLPTDIDTLGYTERREVLKDLGATVWLYPEKHKPRWALTFAFEQERLYVDPQGVGNIAEWRIGAEDDMVFSFGGPGDHLRNVVGNGRCSRLLGR